MNTHPTLYGYVMHHLRTRRYTQRQVAQGSGVPFSTICKIAQGAVKEPSVHTVQTLADWFRAQTEQDEAAHDERGPREHELQEAA